MKKFNFFILLLIIFNLNCSAQKFQLSDTIFEVGDIYNPTEKIFFHFNSDSIMEKSYTTLDSVVVFLNKNPHVIFEIGTHLDNRFSDKYSRRLDFIRSKSVMNYLIKKGINRNRLTARGYGKSHLLISEDEIDKMKTVEEKEEAHATNRRTEFKIIQIKEN